MAVWFFYVDESHDREKFCLSAFWVRHDLWRQCHASIRHFREEIKAKYGIYIRKEIHARDFVAGKGNISTRVLTKYQRVCIFQEILEHIASLPEIRIFNICLEKSKYKDAQMIAWDRLLNRIETTINHIEQHELRQRELHLRQVQAHLAVKEFNYLNSRLRRYSTGAVIIADEGREVEITRVRRKMGVFNPVPSKYGSWPGGAPIQNKPLIKIIEDPVFKKSHHSYFLQLADCLAFALLKREVDPTPHVKKYQLHTLFDKSLAKVCYQKTAKSDPLGIVRH